MKSKSMPLFIAAGALALVLVQTCFFVVRETESAIVIELGSPKGVVPTAGLHAKVPWADVVKIDRRNLGYDLPNTIEFNDVNQERITVDAFARYRIVEPLVYYQRFSAGAADSASLRRSGQEAIGRIMQNSLRQTLGEVSIDDIVTRQRAELMKRIASRMEDEARKFGVEIIDVKITQADYPEDIANTVYSQMSSARTEEAELIRSEGKRENTRIQAEANRRRAEILADARRRSLEIQGQADATRNCIFAGAYDGRPVKIEEVKPAAPVDGQPPPKITELGTTVSCAFVDLNAPGDPERAEFFAFYRSLQAYEEALKKGDTTILLSPDSEFFRYFNNLDGRR
ncbi:MAG: protease modulator HflC [Parvularculaceae bacterium]|nr:protease modulator HflC [Parvularculaceae bacterium]